MGFRALLGDREPARLAIAGFVGRLPDGMLALAVLLSVKEASDSFATAGAAAAVFAVSVGVSSPLRGRLVDRHGPGRVLVPMAWAHAAGVGIAVAVILAGAPGAVLVAAAVPIGATSPPLQACMRALWSTLLRGDARLQTAYAYEATSQELFYIVGPALVGGVAALGSAPAALALAAALELVGSILIARAPVTARYPPSPARRWLAVGAMSASGMRALVLATVPYGLMFGALDVGATAFADDHGSASVAGPLLACVGIGSLIGGVVYGSRRWSGAAANRFTVLAVALAACTGPLSLADTELTLAALLLLAGVAIAPLTSNAFELLDDIAPQGTAAESVTWLVTAQMAGAAVGAAVGGALVSSSGADAALVVAAAGAAGQALIVLGARTVLRRPVAA